EVRSVGHAGDVADVDARQCVEDQILIGDYGPIEVTRYEATRSVDDLAPGDHEVSCAKRELRRHLDLATQLAISERDTASVSPCVDQHVLRMRFQGDRPLDLAEDVAKARRRPAVRAARHDRHPRIDGWREG